MCFYLSGLSFLVHLCLSKICTYDGTLSIIYIFFANESRWIRTVIITIFNVSFFKDVFLINFPYQSLTLRQMATVTFPPYFTTAVNQTA